MCIRLGDILLTILYSRYSAPGYATIDKRVEAISASRQVNET